jgi:hypothetical protein
MTAVTVALTGNVNANDETLSGISVINVSIPLENTEVPYTFPAGTKSFSFQNRGSATVKMKTVSGGDYFTLKPGVPYNVDTIKAVATVTIILEANQASQVIEIIAWS